MDMDIWKKNIYGYIYGYICQDALQSMSFICFLTIIINIVYTFYNCYPNFAVCLCPTFLECNAGHVPGNSV